LRLAFLVSPKVGQLKKAARSSGEDASGPAPVSALKLKAHFTKTFHFVGRDLERKRQGGIAAIGSGLVYTVSDAALITGRIMRLFFSLSSFAFTMLLALVAFTYTAIHHPTTMRDLLYGAQEVRDRISLLGLPDSYMVWVDIFLQPNQIVLIGFSIAMRLLIGLVGSIFGSRYPDAADPQSSSTSNSPFSRWG
jgi:hypothetical protein